MGIGVLKKILTQGKTTRRHKNNIKIKVMFW